MLRRFIVWRLRVFTAMNASPPAISPAALLLIYASVFLDTVISSFLKVYVSIFCNLKYSIQKSTAKIHSSQPGIVRENVLQLKKQPVLCLLFVLFVTFAYITLPKLPGYPSMCQNAISCRKTCKNRLTKILVWCIIRP